MIAAKVICDSIANDIRLTTLELCYPRFIHSEVMTHRMFSRNASSSRAIPVEKMIRQVKENPAMPIHWGKNQPGMQAREECDELIGGELTRESTWECAARDSIEWASLFSDAGYHKQVVNRLLEPFQWIKVIVTATEWDNFFKLRLHPDAQPEIQELARCMKQAMDESTPAELKPGEWHLPYVTSENFTHMMVKDFSLKDAIKCSTARIARISYNNHDGSNPVIEKDIGLHDGLLVDGHMSPFEHIATPMETVDSEYYYENFGYAPSASNYWERGITHLDVNHQYWSGNLRGWIQYRQLIEKGAA